MSSKHRDEIDKLVTVYKDQRAHQLPLSNALNLNLWEYNFHQPSIKTEKDLAFDRKDFTDSSSNEPFTPVEYTNWMRVYCTQTGDMNCVSYATLNCESSLYEDHYLSVKIFVAGCNASYKRELTAILFPVFVHFYLDLISRPDTPAAQAFFTKFHSDHDATHKQNVDDLSKVTVIGDLKLFTDLKEIRERKTRLKLSLPAYYYLLQHLRHTAITLVLHALNTRFTLLSPDDSDADNKQRTETFTEDERTSPTSDSDNQQDLTNLRQSISAMNNLDRIAQPSICLYGLQNAYNGVCCARFSTTHLACGFEDSSIRLWGLGSKNSFDQSDNSMGCTTLRGHSGPVYQCHYSGQHLLTCSKDKSVRLWSGSESVAEYRGHDSTVWDVCGGRDNTYFASASFDRTLRLWNTEYAYPLRIFPGHTDSVDSVIFHPNCNYVASGSTDKSIRLWDIQSGQFVRVFLGHKSSIHALAFSPDGKYLVSAGDDYRIIVWDLANGQLLNAVRTDTKITYTLSFSHDGSLLASGGLNTTVDIWSTQKLFKRRNNAVRDAVSSQPHALVGKYRVNKERVLNVNFSSGNLLFVAAVSSES